MVNTLVKNLKYLKFGIIFLLILVTSSLTLVTIKKLKAPSTVLACDWFCECGCSAVTGDCRRCDIPNEPPPPDQQCSGPNDCPGSCCNGGQCGPCNGRAPILCPAGQSASCDDPVKFKCLPKSILEPPPVCYDDPYVRKWIYDGKPSCDQYSYSCDINCGCCANGSGWFCNTGATTNVRVYSSDGFACPGLDEAMGPATYDSGLGYYTRPCRKVTCACAPICTVTSPSNLSATSITNTSAKINWTKGTGGSSQRIRIGTNKSAVEAGCPNGVGGSTGCTIKVNNIASSATSYTTADVLTAGTTYYAVVTNYSSSLCEGKSPTLTFATTTPSCSSVAISDVASPFRVGTQTTITASIVNLQNGTPSNITFTSSDTSKITVSPVTDTSVEYQTQLSAISAGTSTITASVKVNGNVICDGTRSVNASDPDPNSWWQVKDGDVTTNKSIKSKTPVGLYFNTVGNGGFPGVPVYGGTFNLTAQPTRISATQWNSKTETIDNKLFNYSYFKKLIPSDVVWNDMTKLAGGAGIVTDADGYQWFKATGDYTINANITFGGRRVILFVENGDLNINAKINLANDSGFFAALVNGDINVDPTVVGSAGVPTIEGLYLSDGVFSTGTKQPSDILFYLRGSVVAHGGISLLRSLSDNATPAEIFEFAPDQIFLFPERLGFKAQRWVEIAP